ncbi:hypothetical protein [Thermoflavimicrobium dichotomicum]|uniref:HTH cro/C1-type domain-containing protein n=1 Tax=Thermoflavimicrobium dichotomicum TaxID=46223 RepID=A0A1I3T6H6_9BACL|nr:hypothetical protein [Thermoflavimicrobium dichotomicum]SFJ65889.1 hypothetical protein SAMN05421852_1161 [Thermoflavimicrobium dichotomicum]
MIQIKQRRPRLKKLLKQIDKTQKWLSEITGINEATLSRFDSQRRHEYMHLFLIKEALGLKCIDELYEEEE